MRKILSFLLRSGLRLIAYVTLAASGCTLLVETVVNGPQIYANYIRLKVSPSVVTIHVEEDRKDAYVQGTGFHVLTPSGKKVLLTNRHICEESRNGYVLVAGHESDRFFRLKIVRMSTDTDLCEVEPLPNARPLPLSSTFLIGEKIVTAGHPSGLPLTIDYGQVLGVIWSSTSRPAVPKEVKAGKCRWKNDHFEEETDAKGLPIKLCYEVNRTVMTTAHVVGGSSGSPMLNRYGQVVGIVFLRHENNYAGAISLRRIMEFLERE